MPSSIKNFENSLRDYLINMQTDAYSTPAKLQQKYNNLKVYMNINSSVPQFSVSVNISEACYSINPLVKISGSMGADERFIQMWASRSNINGELMKYWVYLSKTNLLIKNKQTTEVQTTSESPAKEDINEVTEIITGSGNRQKLKAFEDSKVERKNGKNSKRARK